MSAKVLPVDDEKLLWEVMQFSRADEQKHRLRSACERDQARYERLVEYLALQPSAETWGDHTQNKPWLQAVEWLGDSHQETDEISSRVPSKIGKFELLKALGRGGMGTVFLARDCQLDRVVALKVPRLEIFADPSNRRRFVQEAKVAASLEHHGLVSVLEVGTAGAVTYIASQWCVEGDLARWINNHQNAPPADREVAAFVAKIGEAIEFCHQNNVVHLDLKPSNIMLRHNRERTPAIEPMDQVPPGAGEPIELGLLDPMITDFGICSVMDSAISKTSTSVVVGTPLYMAPEQLDPSFGRIGPHSDVFAMGVILMELLGVPLPRLGKSYVEIMAMLDEDGLPRLPQLVRPSNREPIPDALQTILTHCLAPDPRDRYRSAQAVTADLTAFVRGDAIAAKPFTIFDSVKAWMRDTTRISDAWSLSMTIHCILFAWMIFVMFVIFRPDFPGGSRTMAFWGSAATIFVFSLPMLTLGWLGKHKHSWPLYPACLLSAVMTIAPALVLTGIADVVPGMYENSPFFEAINHALILGLAGVQLVGFFIAIYAHRKSIWQLPALT